MLGPSGTISRSTSTRDAPYFMGIVSPAPPLHNFDNFLRTPQEHPSSLHDQPQQKVHFWRMDMILKPKIYLINTLVFNYM